MDMDVTETSQKDVVQDQQTVMDQSLQTESSMMIDSVVEAGDPYSEAEIERYVEQAKQEIQDWKAAYKRSKTALHLAKNQSKTLTYDQVAKYLTEEEKEFLAARPNYQGVLEKAQDLKAKMDIVKQVNLEAARVCAAKLEEAERVIQDTTLRIINHPDPLAPPAVPHWPKTSGNN